MSSVPAGAAGSNWLERALPVTVSLGLHVLVVAVAAATLLVAGGVAEPNVPRAAMLSLGPQVRPVPVEEPPAPAGTSARPAVAARPPAPSALPQPRPASPIVPGPSGALLRPVGADGAAQQAPISRFFGVGTPADQVVFVIDCSGSMLEVFDEVRREVLVSISRLRDEQQYCVILFAGGKAYISPPAKLSTPSRPAKLATADFLSQARPLLTSDPLAALHAAFEKLSGAPGGGPKLIYLLTDGVFPDNDKVIGLIRQLNGDGRVAINTYLYTDRQGPAAAVMEQIARENRGQFKVIKPQG